MTRNTKRFTAALAVCVAAATWAADANAQYYQTYYAPGAYQSYYAPAYSSYYAPTTSYYAPTTAYYGATTAYYAPTTAYYAPTVATTGWYPGYYLGRARTALFGPRTTYVASYPVTYAAGYPAATVANYAPVASGCSTCATPTYSAGYAPSCSTCGVQQVTMQSACSSCSTCNTCSDCGVPAVTQTSFVTQPSCPTCTTPAATQPMGPTEPTPDPGTRSILNEQRPGLNSNENPPQQRVQKPTTGEGSAQPASASKSADPIDEALQKAKDNPDQTYFEAPKLFDPKDKSVHWSPAPVHTAVYQRPAGVPKDKVPSRVITLEKAQRDAVGWTSAK